MHNKLALVRSRFDGSALQCDVEEELRFHIEMCAREYQTKGFSPEESLALATQRFGDFCAIRRQCVQIRVRKSSRGKAMRAFFALLLLLGICVKMSTADFHIARIGQVLIMIALMGALLTLVKTVSALHLVSEKKLLRLGLNDSDNTT